VGVKGFLNQVKASSGLDQESRDGEISLLRNEITNVTCIPVITGSMLLISHQ